MMHKCLDSDGNEIKGWTCFHCGETFKTPGSARDHFGYDSVEKPACLIKIGDERGLVMALRQAQKERNSALEICASVAAMAKKGGDHSPERIAAMLFDAEVAGFDRGQVTPKSEKEDREELDLIVMEIRFL